MTTGPILAAMTIAASALLVLACQDPTPDIQTSQQARSQAPTRGRLVLDQHPDGLRIAGTPEPVRPGTDALRVVVLDGELPASLQAGQRVLDAAFVADGLVVLGADRVLRHVSSRGDSRQLDTEVLGPLSVAGGRVAYVGGEPPDLQLRVVELRSGESSAPAPDLMPAWSPALSPDGRELIFVASHAGRPQLFRIDANGETHQLPTGERTPSSPVAPSWSEDRVFAFQDEHGVVTLDPTTGEILEQFADGATLLPDDGSGRVRIVVDGRERTL